MADPVTDPTPLTLAELEEAEKLCLPTLPVGGNSVTLRLLYLPRALSSLKRAMDLLELADLRPCPADDFDGTPCGKCEGCTWNAERNRLLDGWLGK